jgi:hypothetical protein
MKIIITEAQFGNLNKETIKEFLYSFWDNQKKYGEKPTLDDIIYQITNIRKYSDDEYEIIRPIWYDYNGGYEHLLQKMKDEIEHDEIHIKGDSNLDMIIFVDDIYSNGETEQAGTVEIICTVVGGTIDGELYNEETNLFVLEPNLDIFEYYMILDYDGIDLVQFLTDEVFEYFSKRLRDIEIPIQVDLTLRK